MTGGAFDEVVDESGDDSSGSVIDTLLRRIRKSFEGSHRHPDGSQYISSFFSTREPGARWG